MASPQQLFWAKIDKQGDAACWKWLAATDKDGYGVFTSRRLKPRMWKAHRMMWELAYGEIPSGLCVLHKCDNTSCVNPAHLFLGSQSDNMCDMIAKGRRGKCAAKISADDVVVIRQRCANGELQRVVAADYALTQAQISAIVLMKKWKHLPSPGRVQGGAGGGD